MIIQYVWNIDKVENLDSTNSDLITQVSWSLIATDTKNNVAKTGICGFVHNKNTPIVPSSEITNNQLTQWIEESIGEDSLLSIKETLTVEIQELNAKVTALESQLGAK